MCVCVCVCVCVCMCVCVIYIDHFEKSMIPTILPPAVGK